MSLARHATIRSMAAPHRVLVVDDDVAVLRAVARVLEKDGHHIETRESAGAAFALDLSAISLLLLDVGMPGISGLQLAGILRASNAGLPVIIMSGDVDQAKKAGWQGLPFLAKPFAPDELRALVTVALREAEMRRQATPPQGLKSTPR